MLNLDIDSNIIPWIEIKREIAAGHHLKPPAILFRKLEPEMLSSAAGGV
jgi:hypothetical protein